MDNVYDRLDEESKRVRREESFNTIGESVRVKQAGLESVLCFLHEHGDFNRRDVWATFIEQIRSDSFISFSLLFEKLDNEVRIV